MWRDPHLHWRVERELREILCPPLVSLLPAALLPQAVNMPFPGYNIHLVNEAYGIPPGWLQSSLYRSVSNILPVRTACYKH